MRAFSRLFQVSWTVAALACGSDLNIPTDPEQEVPGDVVPASATRSTVSVDPSTIVAGSGTAIIMVTVRDTDGNPVEGAVVSLQGSGVDIVLTQPTGVTGPDGMVTGTLQSGVPGTKIVSAMINGSLAVTQTAQVNVLVVSASRLELVAGDDQTAPAGTAVPVQPAVRVVNSQGQPVPGYGVSFAVTSGGGTVSPATQTTDAAGIARVAWALGAGLGINTLVASATGLEGSPVIFSAEAIGGGGGGGGGGGDDGGGGGGDDGGGGGDDGGGGGGDDGGGGGGGDDGGSGGDDGGGGGDDDGGGGDNGGGGDDGSGGPSDATVDRLIYQIAPPSNLSVGQFFTVRVALVDAGGNVVPLDGVFIYVDLFREGDDHPTNSYIRGERFDNTEDGATELTVEVTQPGSYRLRALTDDLPSHQPHGPEPYLFSGTFTVD